MDGPALNLGGQRNGPCHAGAGPFYRLGNLPRRMVYDPVVIGLQPNPNPLCSHKEQCRANSPKLYSRSVPKADGQFSRCARLRNTFLRGIFPDLSGLVRAPTGPGSPAGKCGNGRLGQWDLAAPHAAWPRFHHHQRNPHVRASTCCTEGAPSRQPRASGPETRSPPLSCPERAQPHDAIATGGHAHTESRPFRAGEPSLHVYPGRCPGLVNLRPVGADTRRAEGASMVRPGQRPGISARKARHALKGRNPMIPPRGGRVGPHRMRPVQAGLD